MRNPYVYILRSDYPRIVQKVITPSQKAMPVSMGGGKEFLQRWPKIFSWCNQQWWNFIRVSCSEL